MKRFLIMPQRQGQNYTGRFFLFGFFCLFSLFYSLYAKSVISTNSGNFIFKYKTTEGIIDIKVYYYAPKRLTTTSRIVFVLHGDNRNGAIYRDEWKKYAYKYNFLVLSPELTEKDFPYMKYNLGNVYDEKKKRFNPKEEWSFNIIEQLFDFVRDDGQMKVGSYCIFGHSSGAQFVQRMVLFMPDARFSMAIANGGGWYTLPSFEYKFDTGLRLTPLTEETLKKAFKKNLIILMGEKDYVSKKMPGSYSQTTHKWDRLWRAKFFYEEAKSKSQELGVELNWLFKLVPDADHNNPKHALFASRYISRSDKNIEKPEEIEKKKN